ncbi:distal tail protein Dit [Lacticaseibacillus paracasei]|uniref:Phage tail family protein n=3 Tax=Lacticaseibacillus paracasei TaxID=1597 RepID=A0ABD5CZ55_LACPA|nr:distal tail protein Dit [Lacticaseibacillus paracasei]MBS0991373.1 phage tail family protein [Lacticaseibacillus paracasei]MDE3280026.1 phage tail family protein [Lacticaseibacillus paracasei]MDR7624666.1 phage tail family protein [Lacticaseibacillus paracasei]QPC13704.1 phage tail family protein [Lacticaseibacillus paracasei subsp. tolerans]WMX60810.1 phage tail family protein [Lacticaseibacillus paracasei]
MYDFRETTPFTGSDDNQRPAEAMLIDGHYIEDLIPGYSTLQVSGRELLSQSIEKQTIGKSDGEFIQYVRNPSREIVVGYRLAAADNLSFRQAFYKLNDILHGENHQVSFNDDPSKYWIATFSDIDDVPKGRNAITSSFTLFVPDGIAHSVATQTADNMPYKDVPVNLAIASHASASNTTIVDGYEILMGLSEDLAGKTITTSAKVIVTNYQGKIDPNSGDPDIEIKDGMSTGNWNGLINPINVTGNGVYTSAPSTTIKNPLTGTSNQFGLKMYNLNATIEVWIKVELGTSASPWSPNPADPEYYTDTITVPNAGTYPSEPVIEATINGDDGVLTAINDQGSVLQFGSPDETDGFVKQKSERVYHLDFNQTPTGVTLNNGVTAFPYYEHGNDANVQSGPFGYANGIAYPSTERTASNYWNGPSMSGTIPKNSSGSNTANFQFVNRVNVGTNAAEVGRFEFNLTYQGKIVASLALFDDSASNDQWVFSGTVYDGSHAQMLFFDLLPRNYYRDGNYNAVITKMGDQLTFRLDRIDLGDGGIETRTVSGFSSVPIDGWTAWFPGFSDQRGWSINWKDSYFEWINVDYWDDIPNRFKDGDVVKIDVANRRVLVNGAEDRTLQTIGNDWGGFKIQPGNNTIELLTSSWAKQCKAEVSWQEAWL